MKYHIGFPLFTTLDLHGLLFPHKTVQVFCFSGMSTRKSCLSTG